MARQPQSFFLEEWLQAVSSTSNKTSTSVPSSSAQAIIQAWADLRDSLQRQSFNSHHTQALKVLASSQASIYVADPQAKVLVSILSSQHHTLPAETFPLFLRLLYIWVRKSRQSSAVIDYAVEVLVNILSKQSDADENSLYFSEGILLMGALSFQSFASQKSKTACLELLCKLLEEKYKVLSFSDELASHALAGAGYALSSSVSEHFGRILDTLLSVWGQGASAESISQGLMLLHLVEWALSNALHLRSLDKLDSVSDLLENVRPSHSSAAVVITAGGILRATNRSGSSGFLHLKNSAEGCIETIAKDFATVANGFVPDNEPKHRFLLQCIALALARAGSVSYRPSLFVALAQAVLTEIFPLRRMYSKILKFPGVVLHEIKQHLVSIIFKEAGAATGVFCNMYASANEESRSTVENFIWNYCKEVYLLHRQTSFVLSGRGDNIIGEIEKIAESAFLMVVVFALGVTKHNFNSRINEVVRLQTCVEILVSFSCMEYFRRMRLPEYMDTIRAVIVSLQENELACISFVESLPSYDDLLKNHGSSELPKVEYLWANDEVQAARVVFYMRVIPTCVEHIPASVFEKVVTPTMFLYMGHPNGKVARYSHSMFAAFISSGKDPLSDEKVSLKEKLVFYYVQRSLEGYPGITPFEGMASGVAALVRHLPAGSPSIFYCIHCLIEKAKSLCSGNWDEESEPSNKLLDLLLRLLALVDIQVLPSLMKLLAQLIVQLPVEAQNMLLNQLYQQIAESDDVTRKPALISWLQSLSYLCSQGADRKEPQLVGESVSARSPGAVTLNRVNARL